MTQRNPKRAAERMIEIPSRMELLNVLSTQPSRFWTLRAISKHCRLNKQQEEGVTKRLLAMTKDKQVAQKKDKFKWLKPLAVCYGRVVVRRFGDAYVLTDSDQYTQVQLSGRQSFDVLPDDKVNIMVTHQYNGLYYGVLTALPSERITVINGLFDEDAKGPFLMPLDKRLPNRIALEPTNHSPEHGVMIEAKILVYPYKRTFMCCKITRTLGRIEHEKMEHRLVMQQYQWSDKWPPKVEKEAARLVAPDHIPEDRSDWTALPFVTIDGDDARDYDDAVAIKTCDDGWELSVAIADVSHYVTPGSALDDEAKKRATSIYLPGKMIPMLPEKLSCDLCSLTSGTLRYAMGATMHITQTGQVSLLALEPVVIQVKQRLTYREVNEMLDGNRSVPSFWQSSLAAFSSLYSVLLKQRKKRCALDFDGQEVRMKLNAKGKIAGFYVGKRGLSERFIEEMMILTNEQVAIYLGQHDVPALYRAHLPPESDRIQALNEFLKANQLPRVSESLASYHQLIEQLKALPNGRVYQQMVLRSLRQAQYDTSDEGHFGLGLDHYLHFTSPIRRYPDLLVHRAVRHLHQKRTKRLTMDEGIAKHCSIQERQAEEGSRLVENWLKCQYLQKHINKIMKGTITSVVPFGFFVSLDDLHIEGLVHVTRLPLDRYSFHADTMSLVGEKLHEIYSLGDVLSVRVAAVTIHNQQIDFDLAD